MKQEQLIKRYFSALRRADVDGLMSLFSEDATAHECGWCLDSGVSALRTHALQLRANTTKRRYTIERVFLDADAACVEWTADLTFGAGARLRAFDLGRGLDLTLRGTTIFGFSKDRIARLDHYFDRSELMILAEPYKTSARRELPPGAPPVSDRPLT